MHQLAQQMLVRLEIVVLHVGIKQTDADTVFAEAAAAYVVFPHHAHEVGRAPAPGLFDLGHGDAGQQDRIAAAGKAQIYVQRQSLLPVCAHQRNACKVVPQLRFQIRRAGWQMLRQKRTRFRCQLRHDLRCSEAALDGPVALRLELDLQARQRGVEVVATADLVPVAPARMVLPIQCGRSSTGKPGLQPLPFDCHAAGLDGTRIPIRCLDHV